MLPATSHVPQNLHIVHHETHIRCCIIRTLSTVYIRKLLLIKELAVMRRFQERSCKEEINQGSLV